MRRRRSRRSATSHDAALHVLREAQLLLLSHPVAVQGVVRALVAEGRRFGKTANGRRWRARLARSDLARRGRLMWQATALNMIEERSDSVLPTALLDAVLGTIVSADPTPLLGRLVAEEKPTGVDDPQTWKLL
jgi:hypothetical protein